MTAGDQGQRITDFVAELIGAMGLRLAATADEQPDHVRIDLQGDDSDLLLRRKGEALDALQHVVNAVFRDDVGHAKRLVVDCMGFRRAKDRELQQMARFLMDKVRQTGVPQEMGPLNSYARRLVHLEVGSEPDLQSESQGDGALKHVIITRKA